MTRLQTAIITSFSTGGILDRNDDVTAVFARCDQFLREHCGGGASVGLDLYVAMEADLVRMAKAIGRERTSGDRPLSILDVLGEPLDPSEIEAIADLFAKAIEDRCGRRSVVAITTFVPEISQFAEDGQEQNSRAETALANILRIGRGIRKKLPVPGEGELVVEAVTGSVIKGLETVDASERFSAQMRRPDEVRRAVLQSLKNVLTQVLADKEGAIHLPRIALELEPGPYFALNDKFAIAEFSNAIVADPMLKSHVGFNLDIAHWRIANVDIGALQGVELQGPANQNPSAPALASQILHAHISGHHPNAHFGDCSIRREEWRSYKSMFDWLQKLADGATQGSSFSRTISVELEAINRPEYVQNFYRDLLLNLD